MPFIASNYANNPKAPLGKWVCSPSSGKEPFSEVPTGDLAKSSSYCGQCVSYVKTVCPVLPATISWKKGAAVKNNRSITPGTIIATFNSLGRYEGHAAVYVRQTASGIDVYDQYVNGASPKAVGPRLLRWGAGGRSNNGDNFYVVE